MEIVILSHEDGEPHPGNHVSQTNSVALPVLGEVSLGRVCSWNSPRQAIGGIPQGLLRAGQEKVPSSRPMPHFPTGRSSSSSYDFGAEDDLLDPEEFGPIVFRDGIFQIDDVEPTGCTGLDPKLKQLIDSILDPVAPETPR